MYWRKAAFFRLHFVLLLFLLQIKEAVAQENNPWMIGINLQKGAIIQHTAKIKHFAGTHPTGLEINLQTQTTGKYYWQQLYRYPRVGLSLIFLDYHDVVIGKSLALSPYLSLPVKITNQSQVHFRFGTGLAYFSNYFDRKVNPGNNMISTNFNAVIQTRLEYEYKITDKLYILGGLGLNHYSNGGNAKPNLGVNIATGSLGLNFNSGEVLPKVAAVEEVEGKRNFISLSSSIGIKQRNDFDTLQYIVKSVALTGSRLLNQKSTLLVGLEGFYDPSLLPRRAWDPRVKPGTTPDIRRVALNAGHELRLGKLSFGTHVGWYFYRPYKADAPFYQRLETKIQVHKNIFVAAGLKLHDIIKADIIEYRLGLRI